MEKNPYEFHVTVEAQINNIEEFKDTCRDLAVKPIVLDLGINNDTVLTDFMTSSTAMYEDDMMAYLELRRIADGMGNAGLNVLRRKIETAPWHPTAPSRPEQPMPDGCYFESHLALSILAENIPALRQLLATDPEAPDLHLSRNAFKPSKDGRVVMMTTLRKYDGTSESFATAVEASKLYLVEAGYQLEKDPIIEYALYDSNVHHDTDWMKHER